jgi:hypothetical protein
VEALREADVRYCVQVDLKFIAPLASSSRKKYYQFTAIDDCIRLRVLRIYDRLNQKTAIQFADFLLDKFPFRVEAIQTDNGLGLGLRASVSNSVSKPSQQMKHSAFALMRVVVRGGVEPPTFRFSGLRITIQDWPRRSPCLLSEL